MGSNLQNFIQRGWLDDELKSCNSKSLMIHQSTILRSCPPDFLDNTLGTQVFCWGPNAVQKNPMKSVIHLHISREDQTMLISTIKVILKILPLISALFGLFFLTQQIFPDLRSLMVKIAVYNYRSLWSAPWPSRKADGETDISANQDPCVFFGFETSCFEIFQHHFPCSWWPVKGVDLELVVPSIKV